MKNYYICAYCNEVINNEQEHNETECKDIIIEKINKKLEYLNVYLLKQIYNYILSL